jgi:hypothetical protein
MRESFRRAGYLVTAVLLAAIATLVTTGTASAEKQPNSLQDDISTTFLRPCASPCGVQDAVGIPAGTAVHTYCAHNDYNVAYSGPSTGRGGFVFKLRLDFPELQQQSCTAAGAFASVNTRVNLSSCSGTCVNFGEANPGNTAGVFCQLGSGQNLWYLSYVDQIERAGFLPQAALNPNPVPNVPSCNQGF